MKNVKMHILRLVEGCLNLTVYFSVQNNPQVTNTVILPAAAFRTITMLFDVQAGVRKSDDGSGVVNFQAAPDRNINEACSHWCHSVYQSVVRNLPPLPVVRHSMA
jgi:phospholipid N-methyltransferase